MDVTPARKKRPLIHRLFILVLTPMLIATDLLGTVPNNSFSAELRGYLSLMLPAEFTGWLNQRLTGYDLPTLPVASISQEAFPASPIAELPLSSTLTAIPSSTLTPTFTLTPTSTATSTRTPTPTITPTPTLIPNPAGLWLFSWQYPGKNTTWADSFRIIQRGDNFVVTFVSNSFVGDLTILSQHWDGTSLDFTYQNPAIPATVHLKTIGIDSQGQLWVNVLSQWVGPPVTVLPPVQ